MDGAATSGHDELGRLVRGHSEYAARKRRLAERVEKLRLDYSPSPSQEMLLVVIAGHLDDAERCRSAIARTRATNAARRLLRDIPRRPSLAPRPVQALETARELLERMTDGHD
jgi:hypothetical protein